MSKNSQMKPHRTRSDHLAKHNKRLRKYVSTTPWRDEWELEAVGRALMTAVQPNESSVIEGMMTIEEALETVAVWKARSSALEGLPHAVECTASLAQVHWRDISQQGPWMVSVTELRLAYSSAIIRCINGFADLLQQQRFMAAPISVLCGKMGIASWLVDIRHEASHNALPTLGALRLAASTLLEFLKSEYWIPTCPNWKDETANDENTEDPLQPLQQAIDYLLQYKSCASTVSSSTESASSNSNNTNSSGSTKRKQKMSKPAATTRPVDTFFGDSDSCSSSDDDDGDDWEDPLLGNVLGSSMGTNINRFAVLEPPKATKKQEMKTKAPKNKKQPGERYPIDYAKDFVRAVAPQEGVSTALTFLVWGGIGGAPAGRGVLIPGSAVAFPASQQGIMKCWQRYSPLIEVLGRAWPGFCSTLLVHLVDFVLSIEDTVVQQSTVDAGSARKLYFLSAWIRLLLSQLFTAKLDPEFISKSSKTKGTKTELVLAQLSHLQKLEYPLNSLCDRCIERDDSNELRKTSRAVLHSLEEILGAKRVPNFGIRHIKAPVAIIDNSTVQEGPRPLISSEQMLSEQQEASTFSPDKTEAHTSPAASACKMSLHDIEAMLSDDEPQLTEGDISTNEAVDERKNGVNGSLPQATQKRPAWIRCASWDPCSIGTLPGYPV